MNAAPIFPYSRGSGAPPVSVDVNLAGGAPFSVEKQAWDLNPCFIDCFEGNGVMTIVERTGRRGP